MATHITLPNVRRLFQPDPDHVMFEADLKGADAQVVAWEAEDEDLKTAFRAGIDIHEKNAEDLLGSKFTQLPRGSHARDKARQDNKKAVHLTNYGGSSRTLASSLGWTSHDAEKFQRRWFSIHPNIQTRFHRRIHNSLANNRTVENRFGFRRVFFDRIDACFAEALAWIPQSTVALNTFRGALNLEALYWPEQLKPDWVFDPRKPEGLLLQTHDSINFQFPISRVPPMTDLKKALAVTIPYSDPLVIPWDLKRSVKSWGEMVKAEE